MLEFLKLVIIDFFFICGRYFTLEGGVYFFFRGFELCCDIR